MQFLALKNTIKDNNFEEFLLNIPKKLINMLLSSSSHFYFKDHFFF
ncbi:hypothetical protein RV03_GL001123 [Enterococcus gallinarum]|nr:hypothetical protein RV03_GL001123 [Enterococcus gallinarum]